MGCPPMIESLHFHRGYSLSLHKSKPLINYGIISLCGAPTGAGKTYAFIEAARRGQAVFFVVPTQTLADDIKQSIDNYNLTHSLTQPIYAAIWDGRQSLQAVQAGQLPWVERQANFRSIQTSGGVSVAWYPRTVSRLQPP